MNRKHIGIKEIKIKTESVRVGLRNQNRTACPEFNEGRTIN